MRNKDSFEELLSEKSDQYMMYPSDRVWKNIQKKIQPSQTRTILSASFLFFITASIAVFFNEQRVAEYEIPSGQLTYQMKEKKWESTLPPVWITNQKNKNPVVSAELESKGIKSVISYNQSQELPLELHPLQDPFEGPSNLGKEITFERFIHPKGKKLGLMESISTVLIKAKQISKAATWQIYFTPTMGYRTLKEVSNNLNYSYNSYAYNTTSLFARNIKDAVSHRPGIGFEFGAAMYYPLGKKISVKVGLQANYQHYQIDANRWIPEIATYGMNNLGFTSYPINAISGYRNANSSTSNVTLQNERLMISMPMGFDYKVLGNKMLNFSVASTLQPTYVMNSSAYLLSTNLRNYAKAPNLNRRWNMHTGMEANVNFQKGSFKWSIGPQFRYQLLNSFTDKYPIKENLYDFGIRLGVMKTLN
jgi:hypothetical protein